MTTVKEFELPTLETDEGPKPEYPAVFISWLQLCDEYPYLRALADHWGNEPAIPQPFSRELFLGLMGTLQREPFRSILQHVLFELLKEGIKIVVENTMERGQA